MVEYILRFKIEGDKEIPVLKKFFAIATLVLIALIVLVPGCTHENEQVFKVAMVFDSPIADDAFSTTCLRGAEKAQREFGISLEITESLTAADSARLQRDYAKSKENNLIICIAGPSHSESLSQLSLDFPKQQFALVDGDIADRPNISSLVSRDNESSFLAGAVAAMVSQTNQIGFIGGMDDPAFHRFLAGYQAGAQYINPECRVIVDYAGTWANDGKTKALALQQYQQGADIIFGPAGAGSIGVIEAAIEKNLYAIGVDTDQSPLGPQNVLASTIKNVDVSVFEAIILSIEGKFSAGIQTSGLKEGGVGIALNNSLSLLTPEIKARITEIEGKIVSGEITVPAS